MKKLITLCFLLCVHHLSSAQLVIYSENFDEITGYAIPDWPYEFTGLVPWQVGLPDQVGGCMLPIGGPMSFDAGTNNVACIPDCGGWNPNDINVFSYTPGISLAAITGAWLKYDSYFGEYISGSDTERATVEISVDSGATWTVVQTVHQSIPVNHFATQYIDLSAYDNALDIRIGFRYSDDSGWMQGWAIDNISVFKPARKDLALISATPTEPLLSYVPVNNGYIHHASVYNAGLDTIHSFTLNYIRSGGTIQSNAITGATLLPFSTTDFPHNIPDSVFALGDFPVTMWVSLDSDEYLYNDTARTIIRGTDFIPNKRLALESGVGTWNARSPMAMVYLSQVPNLDISASIIEVHNGDPMQDSIYSDFLYNLSYNFVPFIEFDRRVSAPLDSFFQYLYVQNNFFGFANISLDGSLDGSTMTVNAIIKPAVDLNGDYRLALVLTEDHVTGTDTGYSQRNAFASGVLGPMGGYELLANPVPSSQMVFNNVARIIAPDEEGMSGCLPGSMSGGETYSCTLNATVDHSWNPAHMHAIVLLIRQSDSVILNSSELSTALAVTHAPAPEFISGIYPNPADASTKVYCDLTTDQAVRIRLSDLSGRALYQYASTSFHNGRNEINLPLQQLSNGIYLVTISSAEGQKTFKLEVMH